MTAPATTPKGTLRFTAEQLSSAAANERAQKRKGYVAAGRKVLELGREKLHAIAAEVQEVPTDMPHSDDVKQAYEGAFEHMRRQEWNEAREQLLDLAVAALGWCARIDVAETREELERAAAEPKPAARLQVVRPTKGAPRVCDNCGAEFKLAGPGRPPKNCPECRGR